MTIRDESGVPADPRDRPALRRVRPAWTRVRLRVSVSAVLLAVATLLAMTVRADTPHAYGSIANSIPPLPTDGTVDGNNPWVDGALPFDANQTVTRAKVRFNLPTFLARTYYVICTRGLGGDDGTTVVDYPDPCPAGTFTTPPPTTDYGWYGVLAQTYFYSPQGAPDYGHVPPFRVSLLAFGTVPVTATVHLEQTATAGYYDPVTLRWLVSSAGVPAGTVIPAESAYGPAPDYGQDAQAAFALAPEVSGTLTLRLSDVTVDQQPLDVGPSCGTSRPVTLTLSSPPGWYGSGSPDPKFLKGKPGSFQPLNNGNLGDAGWLQGSVDIPPFAGCRDGNASLDPLITAFISGPGNPIETYSASYLQNFCDVSPSLCPSSTPAAAALAPARLSRLSAARSSAQYRAATAGLGATSGAGAIRVPVHPAPR